MSSIGCDPAALLTALSEGRGVSAAGRPTEGSGAGFDHDLIASDAWQSPLPYVIASEATLAPHGVPWHRPPHRPGVLARRAGGGQCRPSPPRAASRRGRAASRPWRSAPWGRPKGRRDRRAGAPGLAARPHPFGCAALGAL